MLSFAAFARGYCVWAGNVMPELGMTKEECETNGAVWVDIGPKDVLASGNSDVCGHCYYNPNTLPQCILLITLVKHINSVVSL